MKRRGGFVPDEVTYPGPLTNPLCMYARWGATVIEPRPLSPQALKGEEAPGSRSSLPKAQGHSGFSCERSRGSSEKLERGVSMQA